MNNNLMSFNGGKMRPEKIAPVWTKFKKILECGNRKSVCQKAHGVLHLYKARMKELFLINQGLISSAN